MNYQIVHSIAGRLRIRIPRLAWDSEFANQLNRLVASLECVTSVRINPAADSLVITYKPIGLTNALVQEDVLTCIYKAGQIELPDKENSDESQSSEDTELEPEINHWQDLGMPALSLTVALLAAPLELPTIVVTAAIAAAAMPWFIRATDSLVTHRQPNIDLLDSLWMTLQTVQGQYAAPALKTCMVEVRRSLRGMTAEGHEQQALELLKWMDQEVWVDRDGQERWMAIKEIQPGDRVVVNPGERIPVDGWILQGTALIDERSLTGEVIPVICSKGQAVFASTLVLDGKLCILAQHTGLNTRIGLVAHLMQSAPVHDTQLGIHQAELVRAAIFPTILLGGTIFALTGNFGAAVSPFQFDFGSGIPISVHTTLLSALTYAARHGIYIRSARVLELLSQLDAVVFDQVVFDQVVFDQTRSASQERDETESYEVVTSLHRQGIATYWITQDHPQAANVTTSYLGIQPHHICPDVLPDQAVKLVRGLQHHGKTVALVGHHTAALAQANVSVSFANQSGIAQNGADVVLMGDDLRGLTQAIAIAKRAIEVVYENTAIIVIPNLVIQIGGGMLLGVNPVVNVITNNSSAFVAEFVHGARPLFDKNVPPPIDPRSRKKFKALQESGASVVSAANAFLKQRELAKRLGVASQTLTSRRSKPEFAQWTQAKDPEKKAWHYNAAAKYYYALEA